MNHEHIIAEWREVILERKKEEMRLCVWTIAWGQREYKSLNKIEKVYPNYT